MDRRSLLAATLPQPPRPSPTSRTPLGARSVVPGVAARSLHPAAPYVTTRQEADASPPAASGTLHTHCSCTPFVGTDHVFRLNGTRVEAFSGVRANLFGHLSPGRLEQYRSDVYALRSAWPSDTWDEEWGGPVSIHEDGSVLAMHLP